MLSSCKQSRNFSTCWVRSMANGVLSRREDCQGQQWNWLCRHVLFPVFVLMAFCNVSEKPKKWWREGFDIDGIVQGMIVFVTNDKSSPKFDRKQGMKYSENTLKRNFPALMFHQKNRCYYMQIRKLWLLSFHTKYSMFDRMLQQDSHLHWQDCLHGTHVLSWWDAVVAKCP